MVSRISSLGLFGLNAFPVDVEVDICRGQPHFEIVGLPDASVRESRERIRSALNSVSVALPAKRITVNLAPADVKKSGTMHDLAILMGIMQSMDMISVSLKGKCFIGEVSLSGEVRAVNGVLPMVLLANALDIEELYVPYENAFEASVAEGVAVYGVRSIEQLLAHLEGEETMAPQPAYQAPSDDRTALPDFAAVKGQQSAKRALEIAAAGGHNALMIGPPGSGKSMLAKRLPSILPEMTPEESQETTNIYSISGMLDNRSPLITRRPFRSPHHTVSGVGLVGGGSTPHPGEISLAHNGLLFLDELAEFDRRTLELMRQPLEDGVVTITRVSGTITYPCRFMLVGAMNPCPCGYFGHPRRACTCSSKQVQAYLSKLSGPLLDRFDLHIEVEPVEFEALSHAGTAESSFEVRKRVQRARDLQAERFRGTEIVCNAQITADRRDVFCPMDESAQKLLHDAFDRLGLSGRAYDRILKVARTIADLAECETIGKTHIAAAVQYRSLDRKYWAAGRR